MTEIPDPKAVSILRDFERMRSERTTYESAWQDIRRLVRPNTVDFQGSQSPGDVRTVRMYDGTAMQANNDLANAVHTFIVNPAERNFGIKVTGDRELNRDPAVIAWCDQVSDIIGSEYLDDRTRFTASIQECFLDLAFGNLILNQEWDSDSGHLSFKACPLSYTFFEEDHNGVVNKLARQCDMTLRQILGDWPETHWDGMDKEPYDRKFCVIHIVQPRAESERLYGRQDGPNMPFSSCWVMKEKQMKLDEGGYISFPYHVGRWSKSDEEMYGRGPAINCLPEIRMLQRMEWTIIRAWEKAVDPPLVMPSDGFLTPFKTAAGSINYVDPSYGKDDVVRSLRHEGDLVGAETKTDQKRDFVRQCFYAEWVKLAPKKERQTAYEISELVEQQLRMMAPMLGRLQGELYVPCIQRSFQLLQRAGMIPPAPPQMRGRTIEVDYVSAAARAQAATRIVGYGRLIQNLATMQPFAPDVMDSLNTDEIAQDMAMVLGVPARGLRPPEDISELRNARAEQQQAQQMAVAAEPISKAVLNLSQAQQAGNVAA